MIRGLVGEACADLDGNAGEAQASGNWTGNRSERDARDKLKADEQNTGTSTLNMLINALFVLLSPLLIFAGWLLTPDWVFGEIFGLRPILHSLWVLISNIVYIIFAFLLIVMAFMNIYGGEKNAWAIKTKLPKLIIGVVSVPFTWFFVSAVISISTVLTASAIQLAGDLGKTTANGNEFEFEIKTECAIDFTASLS